MTLSPLSLADHLSSGEPASKVSSPQAPQELVLSLAAKILSSYLHGASSKEKPFSVFLEEFKTSMDGVKECLEKLCKNLHHILRTDLQGKAHLQAPPMPAVPISQSVTPDYIVCLEDGKKLKMLRRYLRSHYGLTPQEYKERWNLPPDYPMVAPKYSTLRSSLAHTNGLGRSRKRKRMQQAL